MDERFENAIESMINKYRHEIEMNKEVASSKDSEIVKLRIMEIEEVIDDLRHLQELYNLI